MRYENAHEVIASANKAPKNITIGGRAKMEDEEILKMIEADFRFIIEWQGIEWGEAQDKELIRLQNTNKDRFRKHLEINGEISDFRYE